MDTAKWIERALSGNTVWNLGQIDKATERSLNKLVKAGSLARGRAYWQGLSTRPKTVWFLPTVLFSALEMPFAVEAHGEALAQIEAA